MKKEKSCGAIIYQKKDQQIYILMIQMKKGHWSFPKGHVEYNETEEQTAQREVKEETNLDIKLLSNFRHVVTYEPQANVSKDVVYFLATPVTYHIIKQETELNDVQWLKLEEALLKVTFDNDRAVLQNALLYIL